MTSRTAVSLLLRAAVAIGVSGCPLILGVGGDYELAPADNDGSIDGPTGDGPFGDAGSGDAAVDAREGDSPAIDLDAAADVTVISDAVSENLVWGPNPGQIQPCGAGTCTAATEACCITDDAGESCIGRQEACNGQRAFRFSCDERGDCPVGEECCALLDESSFRVTSTCLPIGDCLGSQQTLLCRSNAECDSVECLPWSCVEGPVHSTCDGLGFHPSYCY